MDELRLITAGVLAGGAGTRLRSVVADRPKVLAPVGGKPFLAYLLDGLARQGLQRVVLFTGYLAAEVEDCFSDRYQGMQLIYSREERPLGTAGAIQGALPLLTSETILVLNGDSYCHTNLSASLTWHRRNRARATLNLAYLENIARYGQVSTWPDGQIESFREKSGRHEPGWINGGVYWFERSALADLAPREPLSLEREVLPSWVGRGLYGYRQRTPFLDIGIPDDYARAEGFFAGLTEPAVAMAI